MPRSGSVTSLQKEKALWAAVIAAALIVCALMILSPQAERKGSADPALVASSIPAESGFDPRTPTPQGSGHAPPSVGRKPQTNLDLELDKVFEVGRRQSFELDLRVVTPEGDPVPHADVELRHYQQTVWEGRVNSDGRLEGPVVLEGNRHSRSALYWLADAPNMQAYRERDWFRFRPDWANGNPIRIVLRRSPLAPVRVLGEDGKPYLGELAWMNCSSSGGGRIRRDWCPIELDPEHPESGIRLIPYAPDRSQHGVLRGPEVGPTFTQLQPFSEASPMNDLPEVTLGKSRFVELLLVDPLARPVSKKEVSLVVYLATDLSYSPVFPLLVFQDQSDEQGRIQIQVVEAALSSGLLELPGVSLEVSREQILSGEPIELPMGLMSTVEIVLGPEVDSPRSLFAGMVDRSTWGLSARMSAGFRPSARLDEFGRVRFENLEPGRPWGVRLQAGKEATLQSIHAEDIGVLEPGETRTVVLEPREPLGTLICEGQTPAGLWTSLRVDPVRGAEADPGRPLWKDRLVDCRVSGDFQFAFVLPYGEHEVEVIAEEEVLASARVSINADLTRVRLDPADPGLRSVKLVDHSGAPLPLRALHGLQPNRSLRGMWLSDENGDVRIPHRISGSRALGMELRHGGSVPLEDRGEQLVAPETHLFTFRSSSPEEMGAMFLNVSFSGQPLIRTNSLPCVAFGTHHEFRVELPLGDLIATPSQAFAHRRRWLPITVDTRSLDPESIHPIHLVRAGPFDWKPHFERFAEFGLPGQLKIFLSGESEPAVEVDVADAIDMHLKTPAEDFSYVFISSSGTKVHGDVPAEGRNPVYRSDIFFDMSED